MNQRERFLAIGVGAMLGLLVLNYGWSSYRGAIKKRQDRLESLAGREMQLTEQQLQGELALRQMAEYKVRSLPSDPDRARSLYSAWLLANLQDHDFGGSTVDPSMPIPVGDVYQRYGFSVRAETDLEHLTEWLYDFYGMDYLHRIRSLDVTKQKNGRLRVQMSIEAAGLNLAEADAPAPKQRSWRVGPELAEYYDAIMNRNFFSPPNQEPKYRGRPSIEAIAGRRSESKLEFTDPDGDALDYELVGDVPESVNLQGSSLRINAEQPGEIEVTVLASDRGFPRMTAKQTLVVKVVDPPEPKPEPEAQPEYDDAKQTVLTGLVQGRDDWTAWMNVRTKGKTLKLRVGDQFEIGTLKGKVVEVSPKYVTLEIDGRRFDLGPNVPLAEAAKRAQED
ncbi:MAG: cadherin repeat domain-containing protein [Planctomycetota bacterium]